MRLSFADSSLLALDKAVGVDAACLFLFSDERPLRGIAGYIDWRLCGALSRILQEGRFIGEFGDALLFPARRGVSFSRVFCFGAGQRGQVTRGSFLALVRKACGTMSLAGSQAFLAELPSARVLEEERAKIFVEEGVSRFSGSQILLMGDGKTLAKSFQQAAEKVSYLQVDRELWGTTGMVSPVAAMPIRKDRVPSFRQKP